MNEEINCKTLTGNVLGNAIPNNFTNQEIRFIAINEGEHLESTLHYLEKGWILEFILGPSLFGKEICLFTNHPPSTEEDFERNKYFQLEWLDKVKNLNNIQFGDNTGIFTQLPLRRAGSFHYYFTQKDCNSSNILGSGYFLVNPVLSVGNNGDILLLNSIQCQTVLAKSLGFFEDWEGRLRVSKESGYNMIHFTPVQELGGSNSSYSIKDQHKLNSFFGSENFTPTFDDLFKLINKLEREWKVLSISDVVLNHTANESPWLLEHPECSYNMITAPHLIPAAILDGYLHVFSKEVSEGKYFDQGIFKEIYTEEHLQSVKLYLETELIPNLRLHEYYTCDVDSLVHKFKSLAKHNSPNLKNNEQDKLVLINNSFNGRNKATVDMELAIKIFYNDSNNEIKNEERISKCAENFRKRLLELNTLVINRTNCNISAAICNCIAHMRYQRVQSTGPKIRQVSERYPLVPRYFTGAFSDYESIEKEILSKGEFVMAHNGWVMDYNPLKNFAAKDSEVYIRRELIAWGDSVKLRYGDCYEDCPFLWDHMRQYIQNTAYIFHGIRLDNCHSTSLPVAEYLLDSARKVRPDLYIIAELFTNSDTIDNIFVNRLGISSLIREAMIAKDPQELSHFIHRFGGDPVGGFFDSGIRPSVPRIAQALFFDVTHDNESPIKKKSVFDSLATSALVAMTVCPSGSSRGFDELVPHHIHVVNEKRLYKSWTDCDEVQAGKINSYCGMIFVKKKLNLLHKNLNDEGFSQIYVDRINENILSVTRHNPSNHESIILIAYTAFSTPNNNAEVNKYIKCFEVEGICKEVLLEAYMQYDGDRDRFSEPEHFIQDEDYINGLEDYRIVCKENFNIEESSMLKCFSRTNSNFTQFEFSTFIPGSIIIIKVCVNMDIKSKLGSLINLSNSLLENKCHSLFDISRKLDLIDLNYVLYRCSEEDLEEGIGSYNIPGYGSLVYCGLQGFSSILQDIKGSNNLGHPFCQNLREGDWMLDYISERLKRKCNTENLGLWLENTFEILRKIPRYLIPRYFEVIVTSVTEFLRLTALFQMSDFIRNGSNFVKALAMGSVQCVGIVKSAPLPPFSPSLHFKINEIECLTLCAGLPHFSTGYMRSWGRDTFISLRGLLLLTGRYEIARSLILSYGSCLRHGLIPNLLNCGVNARYNARDAVWWWLYSITSYIKITPDGQEILNDPVSRIFPEDDSLPFGPGIYDQPLYCVMQEALSVHFQGLSYRERNAGPSIDSNMTDMGFNNKIGVDLKTGFVFGGNEFNCGTWMDKMGSSSLAGNRGRPATPRDGSAVELVGLSKAVLHELVNLHNLNFYPFDSVERISEEGKKTKWTFKEWEEKIVHNFEKYFWIPLSSNSVHCESHLIYRRGIYKDCVGSTHSWSDYQFRSNFLIMLTVAPEMVDADRAWTAIKKAEEVLLGPLGMKTLDPDDWNYNGDYYNCDNSSNPSVAHGFNYHEGPEWIWLLGFFLRAKLNFAKIQGAAELENSLKEIRCHLQGLYQKIITSHWRGLPELTNSNGKHCADSCQVQAWSMSCILEVFYDLNHLDLSKDF